MSIPLLDVTRSRAPESEVEAAVLSLLGALGQDIHDPRFTETPRRVAESFSGLLTREDVSVTTFPNAAGYTGAVIVRDIPFHSLCEHHLLPFRGTAQVGYLPRDRIIGLSALARIVDYFARDLQIQERLTADVARWLEDTLDPVGVGVIIEAEQLCMSLRGAGTADTRTTTSVFTGGLSLADFAIGR